MELRELPVKRRDGTGKEVAKRLRRQGLVPAVLYGGAAPVTITLDPRDVVKLLHGQSGSTTLLNIRMDDDPTTRAAIIRDLQYDPVSETILHVDLQEVSMDRPITVTVAVHALGEAAGVKEQSGILEMILREVQVSCLPGLIPQRIEADVSALMIGSVLTVADLVAPEGVRILNDPGQAVATVSPPMVEEVTAPAAEVAAAPAEPEVLTERKPKADEAEEADKAEKKEKK
jgi:large subunit ribosomal protein L25